MKYFIFVLALISLMAFGLAYNHDTQPKITEYKPSTTSTSKPEDDDDECMVAMCNAFGGGIVGDTLALDFMSGE